MAQKNGVKKLSKTQLKKLIAQREKELEWLKREIEIKKKVYPLILDHLKITSGDREYYDLPEFWALQKELTKLEQEKEFYLLNEKVKDYESAISELKKDLGEN